MKAKISGILLFPSCPRFCRLMETRNRRYPRSSGMDGDKSGESGVFLFSRSVPDFSMVGDHSRQMKTQICTVGIACVQPPLPSKKMRGGAAVHRLPSGTSAMDFAYYQSPKLLVSSPPIRQVSIFGALSISGQINPDLWRLSDISGTVGKK